MKNYKVEDNLDFYLELTKSLKEEDDNLENVCLITNKPLQANTVKLECGHSFNYLSIYKDVNNHKNKFNSMEISNSILKTEQIRCPYCRNIQNKLLPYIEIEGVEKIHGVNYFDENYRKYNNYFEGKCCYVEKNSFFDTQLEENEDNPSILECNHNRVIKLKENGKDYCVNHRLLAYKELLYEAKIKAKVLEKENKMKEKLAKIQAKVVEKENKMKEKIALKEANKKEKEKEILCGAILKTGKNKGLSCCFKVFENNKCKKHFNKI